MTFTAHARPELSSHNRKEHSAVAGAAYRLGLRLFDERTGEWHDYRKRAIGEEIVRALTIAPAGAPPWATDPSQLWNRAEKAEKRKDAQVARDYRIPIPKGLTDERAGELAERMARYICDKLHTPVSLGLHRDAVVDVLGAAKADADIGFHAHLYFPTRRLADISDAGGEDGGTGFGEKLRHLSLKGPAAAFVEDLNREWAKLANTFVHAEGLEGTFDHRSYIRMGVDRIPQPTAGRAVSAMERKGMQTDIGDAIRSARPMGLVQQLVADELAGRAIIGPPVSAAPQTAPVALPQVEARQDRGEAAPAARRIPIASLSRARVVGGRTLVVDKGLGLAALVQRAGPAPKTDAERDALERALLLADIIEGVLIAYEQARQKEMDLRMQRDRVSLRRTEVVEQIDEWRGRRGRARKSLVRWEESHPVRRSLAGLPGCARLVAERDGLTASYRKADSLVQTLKAEAQIHDGRRHELTAEMRAVERVAAEQEIRLIEVGQELVGIGIDSNRALPVVEKLPPSVRHALGHQPQGNTTVESQPEGGEVVHVIAQPSKPSWAVPKR